MSEDLLNYMGNMWLQIEGDTITLGVTEEGLEDLDDILAVDLPGEDDEVQTDEICGELDTRDGPLNIYSPVNGRVLEVNAAVIDTPALVKEDPLAEGWLMRIEADDSDEISRLVSDLNNEDD